MDGSIGQEPQLSSAGSRSSRTDRRCPARGWVYAGLLLAVSLSFVGLAAAEGTADPKELEAKALVSFADENPQDETADDSLWRAAEIWERDLANPAAAQELYSRLAKEFPHSRLARRAAARAKSLRRAVGAKGEYAAAYQRYERLRSGAHPYTDERIQSMEALVVDHPDFPLRGDAWLWLGDANRHLGRFAKAEANYIKARGEGEPSIARRAAKGLADTLFLSGDLDGAEAAYRKFRATYPDAGSQTDSDLARIERARAQKRWVWLAWLYLLAFVFGSLTALWLSAGTLTQTLGELRRPPIEVLFVTPVLGFLFAVALASNALVYRALLFLTVGTAVVLWLHGAVLRKRPPTRLRGALYALGSVSAVAAVAYLAVVSEGLLGQLLETLSHGPDR